MKHDLILVGGGLQSSLIALAVLDARPGTCIALVEQAASLGGNHTWCFHARDVPAACRTWFEPLVAHRWEVHDVVFPDFRRTLRHEYAAVTSSGLNQVVQARAGEDSGLSLVLESPVQDVRAGEVRLQDGRTLRAALVVDARGPIVSDAIGAPCGYQKFLGLEVELATAPRRNFPILMDATVPQLDGYRFVYTLPFSPTRWLIEDTYFSEGPSLDDEVVRQRIAQYADRQGWKLQRVVREERGVLPMPWKPAPADPNPGVLEAGYRGGWFHPATGYSLPVAVRLAQHIANHLPREVLGEALRDLRRSHRSQQRFCHLLNLMMFRAVTPSERWRLFARFYSLPEDTIQRFYALEMTMGDRARLVSGRVPKGFSFKALMAGWVGS